MYSGWVKLIRAIYEARKDCPHRQKLEIIVEDASKYYCPVDKDLDSISDEKYRKIRFKKGKNRWIYLVNVILHNSKCKFHGRLVDAIKAAKTLYCKGKGKKTEKKNTTDEYKKPIKPRTTRKLGKTTSIVEYLGFV